MMEVNNSRMFREAGMAAEFDFPQLRKGAVVMSGSREDMRRGFMSKNRIPTYQGLVRFVDAHTIEIGESKGWMSGWTADYFVIAVGSRPYRPADVDFNHPRIFDSDTILNLSFSPWSVSVYGAGLGCEYASMFRNLGCKLNSA